MAFTVTDYRDLVQLLSEASGMAIGVTAAATL